MFSCGRKPPCETNSAVVALLNNIKPNGQQKRKVNFAEW